MRHEPDASSASPVLDRRSRKRLATRQSISDTATRLFHERGFDQVTVDEIAAAADVGRKTVFNHFARKEDMFFDLDEAARANLREWLENREKDTPVIESLRDFAHHAVEGENPYIAFCPESRMFVETMLASEALKARARGIRDEVALLISATLAAEATEGAALSDARLAAGMLLATWTVALTEAYNAYASDGDASAAATLFHNLIDRGTDVIVAMSAPA